MQVDFSTFNWLQAANFFDFQFFFGGGM